MHETPGGEDARYVEVRKVAHGAMSVVFCARDRVLGRDVVLKVLTPASGEAETAARPELVRPPEEAYEREDWTRHRRRFVREARIAAELEHPGVVPVYDLLETDEGVPYQVMRRIRTDRTFADLLNEVAGASWSRRRALIDPFLDVCDTLAFAHARGIIHRDVKPENVMLGEYGEVFVVDWGLAKRMPGASDAVAEAALVDAYRTQGTGVAGTPGYMAPEVVLGRAEHPDPRQDVYALGVLLHAVLTGVPPHPTDSLQAWLEWVRDGATADLSAARRAAPAPLVDACAAALEPDPERRLPTVAALADRVRAWLDELVLERLEVRVEAELKAAEEAETAARVVLTDRAASNLEALRRSGGAPRTVERLGARLDALRDAIHRAAVREHRRRLLGAVGAVALVVLVVAGALVAVSLEGRRREAAEAWEQAAQEARDANIARGRAEEALDLALRARRSAGAFALASASREAEDEDPTLSYALAWHAAQLADPPPRPVVLRLHAAFARLTETGRAVVATAPVTAAALVPAQDLLVAGDATGTVVFRALDGSLRRRAAAHAAPVVVVRADGDGGRFLTAAEDGSLRLLTSEGAVVHAIAAHVGRVLDAAFAADEGLGWDFVTAGADGRVRRWDAAGLAAGSIALEEVDAEGDEEAEAAKLLAFAFLPDPADGFASVGRDGTLRRHDGEGRVLERWPVPVEEVGNPTVVALAPERELVAVGTEQGAALLWTSEGEVRAVLRAHEAPVGALAFARGGHRLLAASDDGAVTVWDGTGRLRAVHRGHEGPVTGLLVPKEDEAGFATVSADGTFRRWAWHGREIATWSRPADPLRRLLAGPPGAVAATVADGAVAAWGEDGRLLASSPPPDGAGPWLAAAEGGRRRAAAGPDGTVLLFDGDERVLRIPAPDGVPPSHVLLLPGRRSLATVHPGGGIRLWRGETVARHLEETAALEVTALAATAAGDRLAYGTAGGQVVVRRENDGTVLRSFSLGGRVEALAFSPDGTRLAAAVQGDGVRVAGVDEAASWPYAPDIGDATALAWTRDGARLLVGRADGAATLRGASGEVVTVFSAPDGRLDDVRLARGDAVAVTLSRTGVLRLWHVDDAAVLAEAAARRPRPLTPRETARYAEILPAGAAR